MITIDKAFMTNCAHLSDQEFGAFIRALVRDSKPDDIEKRKVDFVKKVAAIKDFEYHDLPKEPFIKFCDYWTEHNDLGKKMRFEKQKTFNIALRISTWLDNDKKFNNGKHRSNTNPKADIRSDAKDILS